VAQALAEAERHLDNAVTRTPGVPVPPPRTAYFEFEVERQVMWVEGGLAPDSVPGANDVARPDWLVQFIVDTASIRGRGGDDQHHAAQAATAARSAERGTRTSHLESSELASESSQGEITRVAELLMDAP
jgi:hypothetical protein